MKKLCLFLSLLVFLVASCKKETVDVTDLLKTVPSSTAGVVVFNMEELLKDAGCKVKDHKIIPGKEVEALIKKTSSQNQKDLMMLFEGGTGIEPKGAVIFYDSNRVFLTFALYDVNKFIEFIESQNRGRFESMAGDVKVCGNVAVKGSQAWICITSGKAIDPDAIASYYSLNVSQSFLVSDMGEKLLVEENDIRGWAVLDTFMQQMLDRSQRSMFTLSSGLLFDKPESVEFKVDFKKGELEAEAIILNEKGKPSKYQLPSDKVDVSTLKTLGTNCDAMMAFTVNSKLIKKLEKIGSALGGALFGNLGEVFDNVDGTVGLITSGEGMADSVNGVITTKGDLSKTLKDMVSEYMGPVSIDGKLARFSKGDVKGTLSVEECAEELKGACLGMVWDAKAFGTSGYGNYSPSGFSMYVLKFKPESGGLEVEFEAKTSDPSQNALLSLISNRK